MDSGPTRRRASRNDEEHTFPTPRHDAPEFLQNVRPEKEGVGNTGCPLHPQPVCEGSKHTVVTTVAPEITRYSRTQWF
jgi:hypothetical protein